MPDSNGNRLYKRVRYEAGRGWGCNVWFGSHCATSLTRKYYRTRAEAVNADISHSPGDRSGCTGTGDYLWDSYPDD